MPYLEEDDLYRQFHLDEPWDSPHNRQLLEPTPTVFAPPGRKMALVPPGHTVIHAFVGKGTAFEGREGVLLKDFPDGTSNTLLLIEAGEPVPWSAPLDLPFDPAGPLPELKGLFKDIIRVGMADGSRRDIKCPVDEAALRAAITRNGDDAPPTDW